MSDLYPRSLVWLESNGRLFPQIWFGDRAGMTPMVERALEPSEYALTLDQLVARYPATVRSEAS